VLPLLVVDGYNVLHADPGYSHAAQVDVDEARRRLIDDVAVFASGRYETVIVFDGTGVSPWTPTGVTVRWSLEEEADTIVEGLAFRARDGGRPCLVVTTDRATRDAVSGPGVDAVSSAILIGPLDESREEWRESLTSFERVTLADRVSPEVRSRLEGWARGRPSRGPREQRDDGGETARDPGQPGPGEDVR
jgi:predicted RNA-binding protein with PIN domain